MSSDYEWNVGEAAGGGNFDGEEKMGRIGCLEIIDCWVNGTVPMATLGVQLKSLVRV